MKNLWLILVAASFGMCSETPKGLDFKPIAVLELFTSEGCSSCPPADVLLSKTIAEAKAKGQNVYGLAFHVDYWNRLGWPDTFSRKEFTQRQRLYANALGSSVYTPQLVVNGAQEMVGSSRSEIQSALNETLKIKPEISFSTLNLEKASGNQYILHYSLNGDYKDLEIHFAVVLKEAKTEVKRGENGGRTLHHSNVVHRFFTSTANISGTMKLGSYSPGNEQNMSVIAFVQNPKTMKMEGAGELEF